ncbi:MAG: ABC transporter permease subunit, partial [Planctomycetota bacterium]|nr:ABC transporter permease subunit [Planctomycetota bacterium]
MEQPSTDTTGRLGRLGRLTLKELREILRDRRTILTLILMPLLLYPVLSVAFQQFFLSQPHPTREQVYTIAVRNPDEGQFLMSLMKQGGLNFDGDMTSNVSAQTKFTVQVEEDPEEAVSSGRADVVVRTLGDFRRAFDPRQDLAIDLELLSSPDSAGGKDASDRVFESLRNASQLLLETRLKALGVPQRAQPIMTQRRSLSSATTETQPNSMIAVIPLILTLMTVTGAVYPAIDLTAGERERGTLEILVAAPIPRLSMLIAKYVAVLVVALLTAAANLTMMTITIRMSPLSQTAFGELVMSPTIVTAVFALLLLFAAFYSAVLLVVTCTARSFKEAQAYLIPLMLVSLAPGLLCLMPNVELTGLLMVTPLANIVLLGRDLLTQKATIGAATAVVGSTALYAATAIGVAARIFGAESVLYSTASGWGDLWRRARVSQTAPSMTAAVVTITVIFPLFFLMQGIGNWFPSLEGRLTVGGVILALAFGPIPGLVCWIRRLSIAPWYAVRPAFVVWPGLVLLGTSLWALDHELLIAIAAARGVDLRSLLERLATYAGGFREVPVGWIVLLIACVPGVFEEFFFRGFLWSAIEKEKGW